jgi:hypothetical protein
MNFITAGAPRCRINVDPSNQLRGEKKGGTRMFVGNRATLTIKPETLSIQIVKFCHSFWALSPVFRWR